MNPLYSLGLGGGQQGPPQQQGAPMPNQQSPMQPGSPQAQQSAYGRFMGDVMPALGVGAATQNPLYGALAGAGINLLFNYFEKKYGGQGGLYGHKNGGMILCR